MKNPKPFNMPVSKVKKLEVVQLWPGFRTRKQFAAVKKIVESKDFNYSIASGIFTPYRICNGYTGPFYFTWYSKDGVRHATQIGKNGKILTDITST